jgi:DNA adenine methylase
LPQPVTFFVISYWSGNVVDVPTSVASSRVSARPLRPSAGRLEPQREPRTSASPIVKWAGGKSRLLGQLLPMLPSGAELMRHVEPFFGGGAMFFARAPQRALLCDVNPELINVYESVRNHVDEVIVELEKLASTHETTDDKAYYRVRERYNRSRSLTPTQRAATFVYLNKTCFNGLHRVNRRGEFNVPAGRYKNPRILDAELLRNASRALQHAELRLGSFEHLLSSAKPGDFIYFDPPYEPVSSTASFTAYAQDGFRREDQLRLRDVFAALDKRGCKLMLSNSDVPFVRDLYSAFKLDTVMAPRAINRDATKRGNVSELLVRNY